MTNKLDFCPKIDQKTNFPIISKIESEKRWSYRNIFNCMILGAYIFVRYKFVPWGHFLQVESIISVRKENVSCLINKLIDKIDKIDKLRRNEERVRRSPSPTPPPPEKNHITVRPFWLSNCKLDPELG